jgi:hypothetical protein
MMTGGLDESECGESSSDALTETTIRSGAVYLFDQDSAFNLYSN